MNALEDRLRRFAYEWHEAMNSPYAVNMMPLLLEAASDIRSLAAPSLEAENAKLRELVHGLEHCVTWANEDGKDCWSCPLWHKKCIAEDIERELGVEVEQ